MRNLKNNRVCKKGKTLNLLEFANLFPQILLDTDFQRYFRWKSSRGQDYWKSLMNGLGNIDIKVVSIEAAIEYAEEIRDSHSLIYFNNAKSAGYKFISLDGNSRSTWNALFVLGFTPNVLRTIKGKQNSILDKKYNLSVTWNPDDFKDYSWWKTLSEMSKKNKKNGTFTYPKFALYQISSENHIKKSKFVKYDGTKKVQLSDDDIKNLIQMFKDVTSCIKFDLEIWEKITKAEMHEMFINFNQNESINSQDIRNAWNVDMSYFVRNMPPEILKFIGDNMAEGHVMKRAHHEMIGFCQMYKDRRTTMLSKGTKLNSSELNTYWKERVGRTLLEDESKVWRIFVKLASTQDRILESRAAFMDIFLISLWLVENKISTSVIEAFCDNPNQGWEKIMKLHADWMEKQYNRNTVFQGTKGNVDWDTLRGGIWAFTYHSSDTENEWSESLWSYLDEEFKQQCLSDNPYLIKQTERANVNTPTIRIILWKKQDGICPLTGKEIIYFDINKTGRKNGGYEVDHIIPLDKGGTNDIENLQLVYALENAKKSNKVTK